MEAAAGTGAEAATDGATVDAAEEAEVVAAVACPAEEEDRVEAEERAAPRHQPDSRRELPRRQKPQKLRVA
ncbi:hypothetical protein S23_22850 [Bradyrhizobium cosmicum]|uniref:Uncharacterized protein n=1 Tax=Bradyrhizobium cosmicum TaxID=1404864 RepID=A0AAI8MCM1_9BRAD|nr:hypothetical protein S23_22850 [Bradyrhizobium cosmicum]